MIKHINRSVRILNLSLMISVLAAISVVNRAFADPISEIEPNDTKDTAQPLDDIGLDHPLNGAIGIPNFFISCLVRASSQMLV